MSRYTTQVRWIVDQKLIDNKLATLPITLDPINRCSLAASYVFNFDFPIWSEDDRVKFETDFLVHFYFNEIGGETVGQWRVFLYDWLNTNMPFWNMKMLAILNNKKVEQLFNNVHQETFEGGGNTDSFQKYYEVPNMSITSIEDHLNNATQLDSSYGNNHTITRNINNGRDMAETLGKLLNEAYNVKNEMFKAMGILFMGVL